MLPIGRTRKHTYAVPYPSSYHWYEGIQQLPWLPDGVTDKSFFSSNRMLSNSSSDEYSQHAARELKANDQANGGRDILALIIGSVRTAQPTSNNLRKLLYNQCETDKDCQWHKTAHSCSGVRIDSFWYDHIALNNL